MTAATYTRPNYTTQLAAQYKANIDGGFRVFERLAWSFAPHQQDQGSPAPDMTVRVDAGAIWNGATLLEVAAQTVSGFTTPSAGQHRIDRVVLDIVTGVASRIAGTAVTGSPSATAPDITSGKVPVCSILITDTDMTITDAMITDERAALSVPPSWVLLAEDTASGSASLEFTSKITDAYDDYVFVLSQLLPATDNVALYATLSVDNGSTYLAGTSYQYTRTQTAANSAGVTTAESGGAAQIEVANALENTTDRTFSGVLHLHRAATSHSFLHWEGAWVNTSTFLQNVIGSGYTANDAVNAAKFAMSAGNIASGSIRLFGIRKD